MDARTKDRVRWPDAARGLAIILVVLHHTIYQTVEAGEAAEGWLPFTDFLRTMRMPLFFACAGLFAGKWLIRESWRGLFRTKLLLFAWVYLLWLILRTLWDTFVLGEGITPIVTFPYRLAIGSEGWFIYALAAMFVIARLARRVPTWLQLVLAAMMSIAVSRLGEAAYGVTGTFLYLVFFLIGVYGRDLLIRTAGDLRLWQALFIPLVWIAIYWTLAAIGAQSLPLIDFSLRLLGLASGIAIATQLQWSRTLRHFGQSTLPIYMTHQMWIGGLVLVTVALEPSAPIWFVGSPIVVGGLAFIVAYGIGRAAPRAHLAWLFETPIWLQRLFDRIWRAQPVTEP